MTTIHQIDFENEAHQQIVKELINGYIADEMGGGDLLDNKQQLALIEGLKSHPKAVAIYAEVNQQPAGVVVAFENFSTFSVQPMLNIHDVYVQPEFRGFGIGRALMNGIIDIAKKRNCSRITLEVRHDNSPAQNLYKSLEFHD